jgi:transposase InsO family protein
MNRMGITALYRRPNTSKPAPDHRIYPHLLRNLAVTRPDQVWTMDITYIPMAHGFVYRAAVVDWFSRRVLARRVSITLDAEFCIEAVTEAPARCVIRRKAAGDSDASQPLTPTEPSHRFRSKPATPASGGGSRAIIRRRQALPS